MSAIIDTTAYKCYFNHGPEGPPFNDNPKCSGLSSLTQGGVTAAMPAGSWLGALISGFISDRLGRRYAIMVGCVIWYAIDLPWYLGVRPPTDMSRPQLGSSAPPLFVLRKTLAC